VNRRSFMMTLLGGMAAASVSGIAAVEAAQPKLAPVPAPEPAKTGDQIAADMKDGLDNAETEFSQYYYRRRPRYYGRPRYYRPRPRVFVRRRYYGRPRYRRW